MIKISSILPNLRCILRVCDKYDLLSLNCIHEYLFMMKYLNFINKLLRTKIY